MINLKKQLLQESRKPLTSSTQTYHCKKKAEHHKDIIVSGECYRNPEDKLTQAGEHHDLHATNSGGERG